MADFQTSAELLLAPEPFTETGGHQASTANLLAAEPFTETGDHRASGLLVLVAEPVVEASSRVGTVTTAVAATGTAPVRIGALEALVASALSEVPVTGLQVTVWDGAQELPATLTVWDGAVESAASVDEVYGG